MSKQKFSQKILLELIIMKILATSPQPGAQILQKLQKINFKTSKGTLYPLLANLKSRKHTALVYLEMNSGPARKCYSLTEAGTKHLNKLKKEWRGLEQTIFRADH